MKHKETMRKTLSISTESIEILDAAYRHFKLEHDSKTYSEVVEIALQLLATNLEL